MGPNWNVRGLTFAGCPIIDVPISFDSEAKKVACQDQREGVRAHIAAERPDLVVMSNMYNYVAAMETPQELRLYRWAFATRDMASVARAAGSGFILVQSPPLGKPLSQCAVAGSTPADCVYSTTDVYADVAEAELSAVGEAAYVSTQEWFCVETKCPAFVGATPLKKDQVHLTKQYAAMLQPLFSSAVRAVIE